MNPFPSPLLCLYCDKIILPGNMLGCKKHMHRCPKHPAVDLFIALNQIATMAENQTPLTLDAIRKIAEEALLCEI